MAKNVMCKNCNNLVNEWCKKKIDSPAPDTVRDCQYFCQKTNADLIRAMSDEELAEFIGHATLCDRIQGEGTWCKEQTVCENCLTEWLQQPAEEGGTGDG